MCVDFSGSFYYFSILTICTLFGVVSLCDHGRRSRQLDQYGCQKVLSSRDQNGFKCEDNNNNMY